MYFGRVFPGRSTICFVSNGRRLIDKVFDRSDSNSPDSAPNINSFLHPAEIKSWSWRQPFFLTGRRWCGSAGGCYLFMFTISMKEKSQFWFSSSGAADKIEASHFVPHKRCCWYFFPKRHKLPLKLCFCMCLEVSWNFTRICSKFVQCFRLNTGRKTGCILLKGPQRDSVDGCLAGLNFILRYTCIRYRIEFEHGS